MSDAISNPVSADMLGISNTTSRINSLKGKSAMSKNATPEQID